MTTSYNNQGQGTQFGSKRLLVQAAFSTLFSPKSQFYTPIDPVRSIFFALYEKEVVTIILKSLTYTFRY
jgi:hypothetical protein